MEQRKRTYDSTIPSPATTKKQKNGLNSTQASITTFEDLSNELVYEIFDYIGYISAIGSFGPLNKRFFTLLFDSSAPLVIDIPGAYSNDIEGLWDAIIGPQRHRIRSLHLTEWARPGAFFSIYNIDAAFARLESITLQSIAPSDFLSILPEFQSLPSLYRLSVCMETLFVEPPNMARIYQMLLLLKSVKCLKFSTPCYAIDDDYVYFDTLEPSVLNQQTSNLEHLVIEHPVAVCDLLQIIQYTPKLCHLFVKSPHGSSILDNVLCTIPKLTKLTKLIFDDSDFTAEHLRSLLNALDCRLETLRLQTDLPSSVDICQQWKQLINERSSNLATFKVHFAGRWYEDENDDEDENDHKLHIQNAISFALDPFWYDQGWMGQIYISTSSVWSLFRRRKLFDVVDNDQTETQLQKSIHFNEHHYLTNKEFLSSCYTLIIDDNLQYIWRNYFLNSKVNLSHFPIRQLTVRCSPLFIPDMIILLNELPHVTFLQIDSEIVDEKNEDTNEEYRFDNIKRLQIDANLPWETVLCLVKYFPKLIDLHVYCCLLYDGLNDILGSFLFNDAAGAEYLRRVNRIKEREEQNSLDHLKWINESNELLKSFGY